MWSPSTVAVRNHVQKGRILIVRGAASSLTADIIPYQLKAASPVRVRAINPPNQRGEAAPELEVSLGEGAILPGLLGTLRRSPVGGHQFGQVGSGGPHAGRKRRIAIRTPRPELRLAYYSRNAHLTLRQSRTPSIVLQDSATGNMSLGTARWCAWGHQRALRRVIQPRLVWGKEALRRLDHGWEGTVASTAAAHTARNAVRNSRGSQ